jgi:hypothetical protein
MSETDLVVGRTYFTVGTGEDKFGELYKKSEMKSEIIKCEHCIKKDQQIAELKQKLVEEKQKYEIAQRALEIGHYRYSGLNPLYLKNKAQKELEAEEC